MADSNGAKRGGSNGGGGSGVGVTAARDIKNSVVKHAASYYINHHLGSNESYATVEETKLVSEVDKNGYADVEVKYRVGVRIDLGYDPDTGKNEYENDVEYRKDIYRLKVYYEPLFS